MNKFTITFYKKRIMLYIYIYIILLIVESNANTMDTLKLGETESIL